ncbi:HepT-like ribonuclease domain-containing protein [Flavobacterium sp. NPDC079362]|uniref:HepT-like ribonuclease domain-containing protein n=1 Tax=Flavobacterium sp. NPDC079362 TaxID=3390566 RepID=UPI003CFCEC79
MSIDEINEFFHNEEKDFFKYKNNTMLKRAVERNLEIIGQAINRTILQIQQYFHCVILIEYIPIIF